MRQCGQWLYLGKTQRFNTSSTIAFRRGLSKLLNLATSLDCFPTQSGTMATIQRAVISLLLILSITFVFFAQSTEAAKGPKITHKVCIAFNQMNRRTC